MLITKLKRYELGQNAVEPFRSDLSIRFQSYKTNSTLETLRKEIADLPRASQLCPLLFNICINDIFFFLENTILGSYADDSTLCVYNEILETVICHLRKIFSIFTNCFMITTCCWILVSVTSCYLASKRNKPFELIFNDTTLKNKNCEKILGVHIDSKISFDEHSDNICKTANK